MGKKKKKVFNGTPRWKMDRQAEDAKEDGTVLPKDQLSVPQTNSSPDAAPSAKRPRKDSADAMMPPPTPSVTTRRSSRRLSRAELPSNASDTSDAPTSMFTTQCPSYNSDTLRSIHYNLFDLCYSPV